MSKVIEFWFDYVSPYGYVASEKIEAIAAKHGRSVAWRPFLLGAVFKVTGASPLTNLHPMKSGYAVHDFARSARRFGIPFAMPPKFPIASIPVARATYWVEAKHPDKTGAYVHAAYRGYFAKGLDVSSPEVAADLAAGIGLDRAACLAALGDEAVKARLKDMTEEAVKREIFGSPFMIVDGEKFWGSDRLEQVEEWLARGGW
ncbi:MAG: 2-hydroxychromene-2-carboxylate isomerase [Alphaproteobacteria bacterium]|nr:2-hydroxychromene-2-carboxylate isomerase [Alphaproteobacteria bacterium]